MKKLLILLFLIPLISCTEDWTGEKENIYLQDRNGIKYEVNSEVGFTGKYVKYYENEQKFVEENYKNGKKDGLKTGWMSNGQKWFETNYKNGKREGRSTDWFFRINQKRFEKKYKNDKRDGLWSSWYENGQKSYEGNYKNGKREGFWTSWNKEGNVTKTETYKDGKLVK